MRRVGISECWLSSRMNQWVSWALAGAKGLAHQTYIVSHISYSNWHGLTSSATLPTHHNTGDVIEMRKTLPWLIPFLLSFVAACLLRLGDGRLPPIHPCTCLMLGLVSWPDG